MTGGDCLSCRIPENYTVLNGVGGGAGSTGNLKSVVEWEKRGQRVTSNYLCRAQNTHRHAAFCRAAAVTCREALKMCGRCAARLAAMP